MTVFCGDCGTKNPDTNKFCIYCGKPLRKTPAAAQPVPPPVIEISRQPQDILSPPFSTGGTVPNNPIKVVTSSAAVEPETKSKKNWVAIACLGLSFLSWVTYPYFIGILAILIGAGAIYRERKEAGKVPVLAVLGILIALGSMVLNFSYLDLFAPDILPPHS
jgi:hypothetical protein